MQFLPYKIECDTNKIKFFDNDFKGFLILQTEEDTTEFLREQAIEFIRFKEGGEKADNCQCNRNNVGSMRDGYLVVEEDNGTYTIIKKVSGSVYGYTVTEVAHYLFEPKNCKANSLKRPAQATNPVEAEKQNNWSACMAELATKGRASLRPVDREIMQVSSDYESNSEPEVTVIPEAPPVPPTFEKWIYSYNNGKDIFETVRGKININDDSSSSDDDSNVNQFYFSENPIPEAPPAPDYEWLSFSDRVDYDSTSGEYVVRDYYGNNTWSIDIGEYSSNPFVHEYRFELRNDSEQSIENQIAASENQLEFQKNWLQFDYFAKKYE